MSYVLLTPQGRSSNYEKFDISEGQTIMVGRSWNCDITVGDEFTDAQHIQISRGESGELYLEDLDTLNGSRINKRRINEKTRYRLGDTITIGDIDLRIVDAEHQHTPSIRYDSAQIAARFFRSFAWIVLAFFMALAAIYASEIWSSDTSFSSEEFANSVKEYVSWSIGWSLVAGFVAILFRGRMLFRLQWLFCSSMMVLAIFVSLFADVIRFNLDSNLSNFILQEGIVSLLILLFVTGTLSLTSRMGTKNKLIAGTAAAIFPLLMTLIIPELQPEHEKWSDKASIDRVHLPPNLLLGDTISLQEHNTNVEDLFSAVEKEAGWAELQPVKQPTTEPYGLEDITYSFEN